MPDDSNHRRTNRRTALALLFLFSLMGGLTFLNLLFSNTIPGLETCGLIHPLIFQAQVSFVNPETSVNYNTGFQQIPMDVDGEALDTVLRLYNDDSFSNESLITFNDDINETDTSSAIYHFKNDSDERQTYYIEVATFADSQSGRYDLSVITAQAPDFPEITIGEVTGATLLNGEIHRFFIMGMGIEEKFDIFVQGTTTDGNELDTILRILDSSRDLLYENDDARSLGSFLGDISVQVNDFIIVEVEGLNEDIAANYILTVSTVEPDPEITIGETLPGSLELYERNSYLLNLTPEDSVNIRLESDLDTYLRIYDEEGIQVEANDDSVDGMNAGIFSFTVSNSQTVRVEVASYADNYEGAYNLVVEARAPDAEAVAVSSGELIEARLEVGRRLPYLLNVAPDSNFNITIDSNFDSYLRIYDAEGNEIASNDDYNDLNAGIMNFSHGTSETITIEVASYSDSDGGAFVLNINEVEAMEGITLDGELAVSERQTYVIELEAGTAVNAYLESDFDTYLRFYNESGEEIARNDDSTGLDAGIFSFIVGEDTELRIEVAGFGDNYSGNYRLIVESPGIEDGMLRFDSSSTIETVEASNDGDFESPEPVELVIHEAIIIPESFESFSDFDNLVANSRQPYIYTMRDNQAIDIEISSDFDTYLRIYNEAGEEIVSNDDSNGLDAAIYNFTMPENGVISIEVASFSDSRTGNYSLSINPSGIVIVAGEPIIVPPENRDFQIRGTIDEGETQDYIVTLSPGETLISYVEGNFDTFLHIYDADGNELLATDAINESDSNAGVFDFTVTQTSELTLSASASNPSESGSFTMYIYREDAIQVESVSETDNTPANESETQDSGKGGVLNTTAVEIDREQVEIAISVIDPDDPQTLNNGIQREITQNKRDVYSIELRAGQSVDIILRTAPNNEPLITRVLRKFMQNPFADSWASCLEYYGYTDSGAGVFNIDVEGFSRFVVGGKDSGEGQCDFTGFADDADIFLQQFIEQCQPSATIALTAIGRVVFFVILPGLAILLPILTVSILEDDHTWLWITGLSFVAVYVLTSSLLYLHLGEVSAIVALQEFAYGLFGGTATGAAIAFIGKALDNFSTKSAEEERMIDMQQDYQQQMIQLLESIRNDGIVLADEATQQNPAFDIPDDDFDEPEE